MQMLKANMDSIQVHRIALKSRVLLDSPNAHMSSEYWCGTSRPDTSHLVHNAVIRDGSGEMPRVCAGIYSGP